MVDQDVGELSAAWHGDCEQGGADCWRVDLQRTWGAVDRDRALPAKGAEDRGAAEALLEVTGAIPRERLIAGSEELLVESRLFALDRGDCFRNFGVPCLACW